ncbi:MAG: GMC oxidoreductase [bacterium]
MKSINYGEFDFIIIGSGFGGAVSALRLTEKGYRVLVIEKGKRLTEKKFPKSNWNLKKWLWIPQLKFFGLFRITPFRHITILSGVGVGGGSLVYANTLPIPKQKFFKSDSWASLCDWESELKPFYSIVARILGTVKNPRLDIGDHTLKEISKKGGRENYFESVDAAVYFGVPGETVKDPYFGGDGPDRTGCNFCGGCMLGCRNNAKNTLDKNYLYLAEKLGAKILPESEVYDVEPNTESIGDIGYTVKWKSSTKLFKDYYWAKTKNVIFAGGVLGTLDLLFRLKKTSLPKLSNKLGYGVRTNSECFYGITTFNKKNVFSDGLAISSIFHIDEDSHVEPVRYPAGSGFWRLFMSPAVEGKNFLIRIIKIFFDLFKHPILNLKSYFISDWAKYTQILMFMQTINTQLRFRKGIFRLKTSVDIGKAPTPFIPIAKKMADNFSSMVEAKPTVLLSETLAGIPTTAHILGGCVMGTNIDNGVIDKDNKVFGYSNLYICDGSMISANPGVNPSLTIAALTERAVSKIPAKNSKVMENYFKYS